MSYFDKQGVSEARIQIGVLKKRYSGVGDHTEDPVDEHVFGRSESAKGMHRTTQRFTNHVRNEYKLAGGVLDAVERGLDDTERDHLNVEDVNADQFNRRA